MRNQLGPDGLSLFCGRKFLKCLDTIGRFAGHSVTCNLRMDFFSTVHSQEREYIVGLKRFP